MAGGNATPATGLEPFGPLSGGVKDAEDFDGVCADSIGDDVGRIGDDQFARACDAAGAAHRRILA